jgi:glycosyltransferase involved in cell wall biosynthesis
MKKAPRVLLLVDWVPEKGSLLLESLRKNGLDCDIMGINFHQSQWTPVNKIFSHWPKCLWVSLKAFCRRNDYDYIVTWQQVMGIFLGFLKRITFSESPRVFILTAVIVERRNLILESIRRWVVEVSLKKVDKIGYMSNCYKNLIQERFNLSETQSVHLPFPLVFETNPDYSGFKVDSYLYSVGLSYRDFSTLVAAARKSEKRFIVATTDAFFKGLDIPDNVTVYRNAFGKDADDLMEKSAAVILPLERTTSPAAEATLINAMCYGKPVIVTKTITTEEYITHGKDGLLVPWKDADAIVDAINLLFSDPEKAAEIGRRARQTVLTNHSMERYSKKIIDVIENNLQGNQASCHLN